MQKMRRGKRHVFGRDCIGICGLHLTGEKKEKEGGGTSGKASRSCGCQLGLLNYVEKREKKRRGKGRDAVKPASQNSLQNLTGKREKRRRERGETWSPVVRPSSIIGGGKREDALASKHSSYLPLLAMFEKKEKEQATKAENLPWRNINRLSLGGGERGKESPRKNLKGLFILYNAVKKDCNAAGLEERERVVGIDTALKPT